MPTDGVAVDDVGCRVAISTHTVVAVEADVKLDYVQEICDGSVVHVNSNSSSRINIFSVIMILQDVHFEQYFMICLFHLSCRLLSTQLKLVSTLLFFHKYL